jgi:hypothetical protein
MYLEMAVRCPDRPRTGEGRRRSAALAETFSSVVAEKGEATMFEDDDDRLEAARGLAEVDEPSAAEAFRSIAVDDSVDDTVRLEAARGLAEVDEPSAAKACCSIAVDDSVDDTVRLEAAMLASGDRRWAMEAFRSIAVDDSVEEAVRHEAARGLAETGE